MSEPGWDPDASAPWSEEAEISVLGAMLIDDEARTEALEGLTADDFYKEANRTIFLAFGRLQRRGEAGAADVVTVSDELESAGDLEAAGGLSYLAQLVDAVPTAANLEAHARLLRRRRAERALLAVTREARRDVTEAETPGDALSRIRERLNDAEPLCRDGAASLAGIDRLTLREALDNPSLLEPPSPVAPGIAYRGQSTLAVGGPKDGKTTLALSAAAAVSRGAPWLGGETEGGYVVWIMGEGDRGQILRGLYRFGADPDASEAVLAGTSPVAELRRLAEGLEPALVVVVDTWNTWSAPLDLDGWKESEVTPVLRRVERVVRETDAALVLIHHSRKADHEPMGSTAVKAWADVVRTIRPGDGPRERKVDGPARFSVPPLHYRLVEEGRESARVEAVDPGREVDQQVLDFLEANPRASKRSVRRGVDAGAVKIDDAVERLERDGLVEVDRTDQGHYHQIRQNPERHAPDTVRTRSGHGGSGQTAGGAVSGGVPPSRREGDSRTRPASPSEDTSDGERPKRCPTCPLRLAWEGEDGEPRRVGATSECCGRCRRHAREVGELWVQA